MAEELGESFCVQGFFTLEKVETFKRKSFTYEQVKELFIHTQPEAVYCLPWSDRKPFLTVTGMDADGIDFICEGYADRTEISKTWELFYDWLSKNGGVDNYSIESELTA